MKCGGKKPRRSTQIDITPLMDVMFLLVIFFMVASSFHEETRALEVALPRADCPRVITLDEGVLNITVTRDQQIFLGEREIEPPRLREELRTLARETGFTRVVVRADADTPYRHVVAVIDAAVRASSS